MSKRPLLVDTQLLVLLVVGLTAPSLIVKHKRAKSYTQADFNILLGMLGFAPRFRFCPHVAAEVSNLIAQHGEPERSAVLGVLKALLAKAEESVVGSVAAMSLPEYLRLGLADAAQLALCTAETVLLTDDEPLYRAACARGYASLYFREEKSHRDRHLS